MRLRSREYGQISETEIKTISVKSSRNKRQFHVNIRNEGSGIKYRLRSTESKTIKVDTNNNINITPCASKSHSLKKSKKNKIVKVNSDLLLHDNMCLLK